MDLKEGEEANDSFDVKNSHEEVGRIFSLESKMLINSNALPIETSHTSLDIFERPQLLVNFDGSFEQKIGPLYAPNGPTLEFEVKGDRTNFIDLQNIYLEVKCKIVKTDNTNLNYVTGDATQQDTPVFVNNTLHSLFSDCTVTAQGVKVSSANGLYAHKAFIETEFSHNLEAKNTWLECQGYNYESNPSTHTLTAFTKREAETRSSATVTFIGRVASDFFSCEKHLVSGVELRIFFLRTRPEFCLIYDDAGKDYKVNITQANLYVRKMTLTENAYSAIETTLAKATARYRYTEIIPRTFLIGQNSQSWDQENVFSGQPIRRFILAMSTNAGFVGAKTTNPFHYQKFGLRSITVYRNGHPIAGTPLETDTDKKMYLNSMGALAFHEHGHGISFEEYANHYLLVFDLTSTHQASHDYLHPELTSASISISLRFDTALAQITEVLLLGECASTVYINNSRKVSKNYYIAPDTALTRK